MMGVGKGWRTRRRWRWRRDWVLDGVEMCVRACVERTNALASCTALAGCTYSIPLHITHMRGTSHGKTS